MAFYQKKRASPIIPIVSLIDILTVLLIFFIATMSFKAQTPKVNIVLPESGTAVNAVSEKAVPAILTVTPEGKLYLDAQPVEMEKLGEVVKETKKRRDVAMRADKQVPFGIIIQVLDALKKSGIETLPTQMQEPKK